MTLNNKNEINDRGRFLGLPVTSYGPAIDGEECKQIM